MRRLWVGGLATLLAFALAFACLPAVAAERAPPPLADYYAERWTSREGLPHNMISSIAQAPDGALWMSSLEGVVRYNGRDFQLHDSARIAGLFGNAIRGVAVSGDGEVLLSTTRNGIARLRNGVWDFLVPPGAGTPDATISLAAGRDGTVWLGGENTGVTAFRTDGSVRQFGLADGLPAAYVNVLLEAPDGRMWVGTTRGLAIIDGDLVQPIRLDPLQEQSGVLSLALLADGRLVVGTVRGVLVEQDRGFGLLHPDLPEDAITRLLVDTDGDLWIGTTDHGLFRYSARGGVSLARLGVEDGLPDSRVSALAQDREGSYWVGTNAGLFRMRLPPIRAFSRRQGLETPYVRASAETADGSLWIGTSGGLYRLFGDTVQVFRTAEGMPADSVMALTGARDGGLWIGTASAGLARFDGRSIQAVADRPGGLAGDQVRAILEARDGSLWIGTTVGLSWIRDGVIRNFGTADGLPREFVVRLFERSDGRILVGTSNGMAEIHDGVIRRVSLGPEPVKDIFDFHETEAGDVWLATDLGLLRLRGEGPHPRVARLGRAQGLPVDAVFQILPDRSGGWWLSSNRGLYRIRSDDAEAIANRRLPLLSAQHFNESDGMENAQCNGAAGPAAVARSDGSLWFGTASGMAVVDPARVTQAVLPEVPVSIERLLVDERVEPVGARVVLPPGTRRLQLELAGMSLLMPERIRFRYRLQGFDPHWVEIGTRRELQFTTLPPGVYAFEAQAANPGADWGPSSGFALEVQPWWWQQPLARLALVLGMLMLVSALVYLRLGQLERARLRLQGLVEDKTRDLDLKARSLSDLAREKSDLADRLHLQSQAFERQANEDYLTGLFNRRAFDRVLADAFSEANRRGEPLSLALLDIDFFKRINDQCSHAAGDAALREVALLIRQHCRSNDAASRWGGEEFTLLFPGASVEVAQRICERLREAIEAWDFTHLHPGLKVTVSIGVAGHAGLGHHDRLIARADQALYRAKEEGRNRVRV
ncbi:MAG: diguanylate cyclase [Aquimonas sp.]|nr:diguanylate cyclase [Aquimonas sp.]